MDANLAELFEQYKDEVRETIGTLDSELVGVEQNPADSERIFSVFRHLHSLKGSSRMFGVDNLGHIAHKLEDLMQIINQNNEVLARHPRIIDLLLRGNDIFLDIVTHLESDVGYIHLTPDHAGFIEEISRQIDLVQRPETPLIDSARRLIAELDHLLPGLDAADAANLRQAAGRLQAEMARFTHAADPAKARYVYLGLDVTDAVRAFESGLERLKPDECSPGDIETFLNNADGLIQTLFEVAGEDIMTVLTELQDGLAMFRERDLEVDAIVIEFFGAVSGDLKGFLEAPVNDAAPSPETPSAQAAVGAESGGASSAGFQAKTIRVDEKKIDLFLDSVGKLITQSEILNHLQFSFRRAGVPSDLIREFAAVNRTIAGDIVTLQKAIMEVRQVEINNILKKFPRLVRDLAGEMGKDVDLELIGGQAPIDKSLLDDVEQALIHLIRNAIDHGLETSEERSQAGKSPRGRLVIAVSQEEASICIEIRDDGRGVDLDAVKRRAMEKGWINREQMETMTARAAEDLLFRSGLTTKAAATDISGRGVGLDVVMSNIRKWNGDLSLENRPGEGLTLRLRLPVTHTLLTKETILLRLDHEVFCLPLEQVDEIVTVPAARVHRHQDCEVFTHRGRVTGVIDLREKLGLRTTDGIRNGRRTFVLLQDEMGLNRAIPADEILGQQKIVIKEFEIASFRRLPLYKGICLLGDGRVVLVLDGEKILQ